MFENKRDEELAKIKQEEYKEDSQRLGAVTHIQVEHFSKHIKIEGYYEDRDVQHLFGCDRLMKVENMFGRIQMGYNPNRRRSFIFANLKTSRYDTVSSRYQREMKEYQMKSLLKGQNQNRAYVSKRREASAVLFEKADTKPWSERTVKPYYDRVDMETLRKTMPFLARDAHRKRLAEIKMERKLIQEDVQENIKEGAFNDNILLRKKHMKELQEENLVESLLIRKAAATRYFMRKINYAFDIQKHEMFEYYRDRLAKIKQESEAVADTPGDDEDNEE